VEMLQIWANIQRESSCGISQRLGKPQLTKTNVFNGIIYLGKNDYQKNTI